MKTFVGADGRTSTLLVNQIESNKDDLFILEKAHLLIQIRG